MKHIISKLNLVIILLLFESFAKSDIIHKGIQNSSEVVEIKENPTRKLSNDNGGYMKLYYSSAASYSGGFENAKRSYIAYIINGNNSGHIAKNGAFNVIAGTQIEIHFNIPPKDLGYFFDENSDSNVLNIESIDLSNLDTSSVTFMEYMFRGCSALKSIDLSNCNTSSVKNMRSMFYGCSALNSIDLSSFNTSLVTSIYNMCYGCSALNSLDLSNFNTS